MHSRQITNVTRQDGAGGRITLVTRQETKQIIENTMTQSSQLKRSQSSSSQSKNE
jgi:hypothetical protein